MVFEPNQFFWCQYDVSGLFKMYVTVYLKKKPSVCFSRYPSFRMLAGLKSLFLIFSLLVPSMDGNLPAFMNPSLVDLILMLISSIISSSFLLTSVSGMLFSEAATLFSSIQSSSSKMGTSSCCLS